MTGYSGGSPGADIFGQVPDPGPVPAEFAALWPAGTPGVSAKGKLGHQQSTVLNRSSPR